MGASSAEYLDDTLGTAAAGAWFVQGERKDLAVWLRRSCFVSRLDSEQGSDLCDVCFACEAGQQAIMPDAMEPIGPNVDQEATDKLRRSQAHDLLAIPALNSLILPAEGNCIGIRADQTVVRDRDPMCVSAQIGQNRLGPAEWRFGVDHPFGFGERGEPLRKVIRPR